MSELPLSAVAVCDGVEKLPETLYSCKKLKTKKSGINRSAAAGFFNISAKRC
jgi:hypothetical protein